MNVTELEHEQQRIQQDLKTARARVSDLTERRGRAQEQFATLRAQHAGAVAVLDPEDKAAGQQRRQIREAEDVLADYDHAVAAATARIGELEAAQQVVGRKVRALTARTELEAHLRLTAELDAAWQPVLARLHEFIESARDVAALAGPLLEPGSVPHLPSDRLLAVLLWRLGGVLGQLDATALRFALSDRDAKVTLHDGETRRFQHVRKAIDEILAS